MKKYTDEFKNKSLLLEKITQTIGIGVAIISREYKTIWANEVIKDLFGKTISKKGDRFIFPNDNHLTEIVHNALRY